MPDEKTHTTTRARVEMIAAHVQPGRRGVLVSLQGSVAVIHLFPTRDDPKPVPLVYGKSVFRRMADGE
jgi:hypothetical protein